MATTQLLWDQGLTTSTLPNLSHLNSNMVRTKLTLRRGREVVRRRPLMTWRNSVPQHPFLCMPILPSHSRFILMLVALVWGAVLYQTWEDATEAVIAYASRSLSKAKSHYPAHKLEFLILKWALVEKFHEYLYGSTFDVHTDSNPLTFVLTTAKLDAASHCWVASLANYNFMARVNAW